MKSLFCFHFLLLCVISLRGQVPVDKKATIETKSLFSYLYKIKGNRILYGQQDALVVGANHKRGQDGSDVYDMIQDYPVVYGYDIANFELGRRKNMSEISFEEIRTKIKLIYTKGGIITLSWHVNNPVAPQEPVKSVRVPKTISTLFADSIVMERYNCWLDSLASFFKSLKDSEGKSIPILFRPFHENNGSWFWWGAGRATPQEYVKLWRYTIDYLKNKRQIHNILYVYSTDRFKSELEYLARYPGDEYVDVLGFDCYDNIKNYPAKELNPKLRFMSETVTELAKSKKKICALTEVGFAKMPIPKWWTNTLYSSIENIGLSYILVWGNYDKKSYWGTFKGQISEEDFVFFSKKANILFLNKVSRKKIYRNKK